MTTQAEQDYLKAIYEIVCEGRHAWASTTALARALALAPASVTAMLKKLAALEPPLVVHEPYQGARLTAAGEQAALEVVRRHRLAESFLSATLGYTWDAVHAEAHRLEHAISAELAERLAHYLGDPAHDPHGSPIPQRNGAVAQLADGALTDLPPGRPAAVRRVADDDPALLRYLDELGLVLGARVEVTAQGPFGGPLYVRVLATGEVHALGAGVTDRVFVVGDELSA